MMLWNKAVGKSLRKGFRDGDGWKTLTPCNHNGESCFSPTMLSGARLGCATLFLSLHLEIT